MLTFGLNILTASEIIYFISFEFNNLVITVLNNGKHFNYFYIAKKLLNILELFQIFYMYIIN